jgi:hypothetical protein
MNAARLWENSLKDLGSLVYRLFCDLSNNRV